MRVYETQLPGVGTRYTVSFPSGGSLMVVLNNEGERQVFWRGEPAADGEELFVATEEQARKLGEIFDGTYFEPVEDELSDALQDARVRWIEIGPDAPISDRTIGDTQLRTRVGVSILAIQRGSETVSNPGPETRIRSGDVLVVVGSDEGHEALDELLTEAS